MQGIIYDIKRFAVHDGPGIRTTVFFKGCPLRCIWCHNPESIDPEPIYSTKKIIVEGCIINEKEQIGEEVTTEEVMKRIEREMVFMETSGGGVTFSGGEPTMQFEFLEDLLIHCKTMGINTAVDTSGQTSEKILDRILPMTDLFLFDLKHVDNEKHESFTGVPNTRILSNLNYLLNSGANIRIRVPYIPGFNHTRNDQKAIASYIKDLNGNIEQVDLLPYHAIASHKYKRFNIDNRMAGIQSVVEDELQDIVDIYNKLGLKTSIGG